MSEELIKLNASARRCESPSNCKPHNCPNPKWELYGIKGNGEKPDIIDKYKGKVLIMLGGARGVYEEAEAAKKLVGPCHEIGAINDIGQFYRPEVHHIFTSHPEWARGWINWRCCAPHQNLNKPIIHSDYPGDGVDYVWYGIGNQVASSGWVGVLIAICLGYSKIILCGMPLDLNVPHFFSPYVDAPDPLTLVIIRKSLEYSKNNLPTLNSVVRSMSGKTQAVFGPLTKEWLYA